MSDLDVAAPAPVGTLEAGDIAALLPHAWPFLMLDRVLSVEPGVRVIATKCITASDWPLAGHFPGNPIMPGVLLIEAAAQAAGIYLAASASPTSNSSLGYLATVKRFRLRAVVRPGDRVSIEVQPTVERSALCEFRATLRVDGATVAEGTLCIALAAPPAHSDQQDNQENRRDDN